MLIFGIVAAVTVRHVSSARSVLPHKVATSPVQKRLALIRIFSFLSVPVAVIVVSTGFLRTIIHFMLKVCICHGRGSFGLTIVVKNDLISECTALATGRDHVTIWGVWSSSPGDNLSPGEAARCVSFLARHDSDV